MSFNLVNIYILEINEYKFIIIILYTFYISIK